MPDECWSICHQILCMQSDYDRAGISYRLIHYVTNSDWEAEVDR
jgi:hypothetical protein